MAIKHSLGKLVLNFSLEQMIDKTTENGFEILPILPIHLIKLSELDIHHGDPFDRIIISQGLVENVHIVTSDNAFDYYKIDRLWK
jgi:PIN domain nuclease of toxin-antitoxin system